MSTHTQSVLVLGAGYCTRPLVHYLSDNGFRVIVGSRTVSTVEKLIDGAKLAEARKIDVEDKADLQALEDTVKEVDAVISMLPYLFHPIPAELAIKHKKHFLTTSYVSDAMRKLEPLAKENGVIIVNECGVDPGTDHMSAMRLMDKIHSEGGKVVGFTSYCGGLPAPEDNNNPLGYKFSWAPRGVLLASRNTAHFLKDGKDVTIPGEVLFDNYEVQKVKGFDASLEAYPNRDSTQYLDVYNLRGECRTMIRGTYRYAGWCSAVKKLSDLGYLDVTERDLSGFKSYHDLTVSLLKNAKGDLKQDVASQLNVPADDKIVSTMEWLGLFGNDPLPNVKTNLDALCTAMLKRMKYADGERDMLIMQHLIQAEYAGEKKQRLYRSFLLDFGVKDGDSSMSRTVSYPVAIATKLVLQGKYKHLSGLQIPLTPEFYNPILNELESLGIKFVDELLSEGPLDGTQ